MNNQVMDGHKIRTIRANKLWKKWEDLRFGENMTIEEIANHFTKPDGKKYHPRYVSQILCKLRKIK